MPNQQRQHRHQVIGLGLRAVEFSDDPGLFVSFQFDQDVFLGREVEVERSPHHPRGGGDGTDVSTGQSVPANLSQRGFE